MLNHNNLPIALLDSNDNIIGYKDKIIVHKDGLLHRAFSLFIFNKNGEMLIHKRAKSKYHSPNLWTNTCCSHLLKGMTMDECVHDRLQFEMGFDTNVEYRFKFTYRKSFDNGLIEHETDYVYVGVWSGTPKPNPNEVDSYKWITFDSLKIDVKSNPNNYTYWFTHIINNFENSLTL